jgi:hypothetical protein
MTVEATSSVQIDSACARLGVALRAGLRLGPRPHPTHVWRTRVLPTVLLMVSLAGGPSAAVAQLPGPECVELAGPPDSIARAGKAPDERILHHLSRMWTLSRSIQLVGPSSLSPTLALLSADNLCLSAEQRRQLEDLEKQLRADITRIEPVKCAAELEMKVLKSKTDVSSDQQKAIAEKAERATSEMKKAMSTAHAATSTILTDTQRQSLLKLATSPIRISP